MAIQPKLKLVDEKLIISVGKHRWSIPTATILEAIDGPFQCANQAGRLVSINLSKLAKRTGREATIALLRRDLTRARAAIDRFEENVGWSDRFEVTRSTPLVDVMTVMRPDKKKKVVFEQTLTALESIGVETLGDLLEVPIEMLEVEDSIGERRMLVISSIIERYQNCDGECSGCGAQTPQNEDGLFLCDRCFSKGV